MPGMLALFMTRDRKIPAPTIERLAMYTRPLENLLDSGAKVTSSEKLALYCGVNSAQVRKDLTYFGEFGIRGVGYDVEGLLRAIKDILATNREWNLCIVGMGNLGHALVENENFMKRGYRFLAAFDSDPAKVGTKLPCGLIVEHTSKIKESVPKQGIEIGIVATPAFQAQHASQLLMDAGIRAIMNFAPIHIRKPACCVVENVDFTVRLENLVYHLARIP